MPARIVLNKNHARFASDLWACGVMTVPACVSIWWLYIMAPVLRHTFVTIHIDPKEAV
jgi:hypothetical protein